MGWGDPTHTRQLNLRGPLELHTKGKEGPLQTKTQAVEVHLSGPALQRFFLFLYYFLFDLSKIYVAIIFLQKCHPAAGSFGGKSYRRMNRR